MRSLSFGLIFPIALASAPAFAQAPSPQERARVMRILRATPLIDGHNDLAWSIRDDHNNDLDAVDLRADTARLTPPLHTDLPRLVAGGVGGQFWSVYVDEKLRGLESTRAVLQQIDLVQRIIARYPDRLEAATTADDIVRIHRARRIASLLGVEGGEAIAGDLALLRDFRRLGVRYMTLTHALTTDWADSATDAPRHGGLSPFGEEVVREMNRIGMLVDLSHVSAEAMRDALRVSTAPVIFSHSSAYALCNHPRNVPDDVLALVRANGGVVMVNFFPRFISEEYRLWSAQRSGEEARQKALNPGDPVAAKAGLDAWVRDHPAPRVTIAQVADHIEHIRDVAGVDHVGLGSDFDGINSTPDGLDGVEDFPALLAELLRRGWRDADIRKLAGENVLRVMRQAERVAARAQPAR